MIGRFLLRAVSRLPWVASGVADWYDEMKAIADDAERQRLEDEARVTTDPHDMARWLQDPKAYRRPARRNGT